MTDNFDLIQYLNTPAHREVPTVFYLSFRTFRGITYFRAFRQDAGYPMYDCTDMVRDELLKAGIDNAPKNFTVTNRIGRACYAMFTSHSTFHPVFDDDILYTVQRVLRASHVEPVDVYALPL